MGSPIGVHKRRPLMGYLVLIEVDCEAGKCEFRRVVDGRVYCCANDITREEKRCKDRDISLFG